MQINSRSITALIKQVAADPNAMLTQSTNFMMTINSSERLNHQGGFAGVKRNVTDDDFVGSGVHLKLDLSSGQSITLNIEKGVSGNVRNIELKASSALNPEDEDKLARFLTGLSESVAALFSGEGNNSGLFEFANQSGIGNVELNVQQDKGNVKQRFEFERRINGQGRKEVEGQWSRYDHLTGKQALHNFALSKQSSDIASVYGQLDYKWVLDQVTAGMGVLGNSYTGDGSVQTQVTDFFISGVHSLFRNSQKSHQLLQDLGVSADASRSFVGKTIQALSHLQASQTNMPGTRVREGHKDAAQINGLGNFKADFSSKQETSGVMNAQGEYNLAMSISQITRAFQEANEDDSAQTQFRRLLLEYESQSEKQSYEYKWQHDEAVIHRFVNGALEKTYFKVSDLQQGILTSLDGQREETSSYMQRREYKASEEDTPALKRGYISPSVYTKENHKVHYIT